jgi:hypothetical protein
MRRALLLAIAVLALGASEAQAHTTIVSPNPAYQRWVDEAKVPTPDATLTMIPDSGPCEGATACTEDGSLTIWGSMDREGFLHELGHNFDYYVMPAWARSRFEVLTKDSREWLSGPDEHFASAYARCALVGPRFHGDPNLFVKGNGRAVRQATFRAVCRMFVRL